MVGDALAGSRELGGALYIGHRFADDRCLWSEHPQGVPPDPAEARYIIGQVGWFGQGAVMKQGFVRYRMLSSSQAEMWSMPSFVGSLKSSKLTTYFSKLSSIDKRERYSRSMVSLSVNGRVTWQ